MNTREAKHRVLEVLEGGLRGSTAARIFAWGLIVLIALSLLFLAIWDLEETEPWHETFEVIETVTVGIFTLEVILGLWTADVEFPDSRYPRLRYLREPMTVIQILAILPFYLGVFLRETSYMEVAEFFELLKLLHLLKVWEILLDTFEKKKNSEE